MRKKRLWRALEYEHVIPPLDDSSKLITEYSGEQMAFLRNQTSSEGIDKIIATLFCGKVITYQQIAKHFRALFQNG